METGGALGGTALATFVSTWPRPHGRPAACWPWAATAESSGSVGGGCVEDAVVQEALEIMKDGPPRVLEFGISDEETWSVRFTCGGTVCVYVERLKDG